MSLLFRFYVMQECILVCHFDKMTLLCALHIHNFGIVDSLGINGLDMYQPKVSE